MHVAVRQSLDFYILAIQMENMHHLHIYLRMAVTAMERALVKKVVAMQSEG
jgi:hypothetical protein